MRGLVLIPLMLLAACGGQSHKTAADNSAAAAPTPTPMRASEPVTLQAADGVKVVGRYQPATNAKALILLFHQAESSKDEYRDIQPRLAEAGFASLAIDQRAGGRLFGINETVAALGKPADYLAAKQDLEAALAWAKDRKLPVILWGSSYSASLVFLVAAAHPGEVKALLAFSPGEYFGGGRDVENAAAKVDVPVFVTSSQDPQEVADARAILKPVPAAVKQQFVPTKGGVHGSSTLLKERNPEGAEAAWTAVLAFLSKVAG